MTRITRGVFAAIFSFSVLLAAGPAQAAPGSIDIQARIPEVFSAVPTPPSTISEPVALLILGLSLMALIGLASLITGFKD